MEMYLNVSSIVLLYKWKVLTRGWILPSMEPVTLVGWFSARGLLQKGTGTFSFFCGSVPPVVPSFP